MLTATPEPDTTEDALSRLDPLQGAARKSVSADSIAFARICFGLLVTYSSLRFLAKGWVSQLWLEPENHLTYTRFDWVQPLSGPWMYLIQLAIAASGLAMALGWHHRLAAALFLIGFTWTELIDAALYLNHYWFMTLVGILMLLLPVHHHWSLDARSGRVRPTSTASGSILWVLRAQVGVVYFFAGLAKLNPDWLLNAQPLRLWLTDRTDTPLIGELLANDVVAYLASWGALTFDITIVGWLLWRRSRLTAWIALLGFHVATGALFQIGVFPIVMAAMALIFFEPDWPTRLIPTSQITEKPHAAARPTRPAMFAIGVLAVVQLALPLRHYIEPGNVRWNEDGYYLAWRVMLTEKAGLTEYNVTDTQNGDTWTVSPDLVLTDWQAAHAATRPDLIHQTALLIEQQLTSQDSQLELEIRADAWVSMNGSAPIPLMNPQVDLTAYERGALPTGTVQPAP